MKHTRYYFWALIFIAVISHWRWLFLPSYFSWGDVRYPAQMAGSWKSMFILPSMWTSYFNGFGNIDLLLTAYPTFNLLFSGLATIGIDPRLIEKIVHLLPIVFITPLSSFILIRHFTKNNLGAFVGSIVYNFNVYTLTTRSGDLMMSSSYAIAPLAMFVFVKSLELRKMKYSLLSGLIFMICASYDFRIFYIFAFLIFFYFLFHILFVSKLKLKELKTDTLFASIPFIVLALLSAFWIIPLISTGSLTNNYLFNRDLFGNGYLYLNQSLAFFFPWWTAGHGYALGVVQPIPIYFWSIPIIALLGFILNFKNKYVYFFVFVSLLGILLTKQSDHPFPHLYSWLYKYFPGFNAYREASKFYLVLSIGYAHLIAYFASWLDKNFKKNYVLTPIKYAGIASICFIFLYNSFPLVNGNIRGLFSGKTLPPEYLKLESYLAADKSFSRTLWVPASSIWGYFDNNHPIVNLYQSYFEIWEKVFKSGPNYNSLPNNSSSISKVSHQQLNFFGQEYSENILNQLSIGYIVVPSQDIANDDDVFNNYELRDRNYVLNFLNQINYLQKVDIGTDKISVYKNQGSRPLFYLTEDSPSIFETKPSSYRRVNFKFISPTEYSIEIDHLISPSMLIFSQTYSPGWEIRYTSVPGVTQSSDYHSELDSKFNAFYVSPELIKKQLRTGSYIENPDGSISFKAIIYFRPQTYVYIGIIVSFVSVVMIIYFILGRKFKRT